MPTFAKYGESVGVSRQAMSDYFNKHGLKRTLSVKNFVLHYCSHLREIAAGRVKSDEELDYTKERARREKESADKLEMENEVTRGSLVFAEDVEKAWGEEFTRVKNRLLAAEAKLAPLMVGIKAPAEAQSIIGSVVREALDELSQPNSR